MRTGDETDASHSINRTSVNKPITCLNPRPDTRFGKAEKNAGGLPGQSLDLLKNWIKATQTNSSCADLHVWNALLKPWQSYSLQGGQVGRETMFILLSAKHSPNSARHSQLRHRQWHVVSALYLENDEQRTS